MAQPLLLVFDILDLRAYARAKHAVDSARSQDEMPTGPMVDLVWDVMEELYRRRKAEREGREGDPGHVP